MRKLLVFGLLFLFFAKPIAADKKSSPPSLSDTVYADLAIRHYLDNVSIYYTDGKSTHDIKLNETRHWLPASTVKTFAAMYAYKLISEGELYPYDLITIESKNSVPEEIVTDELPNLIEGDSVNLGLLIRQMITQSDNTSFNVLVDVLGRENITKYIQSLGLTHSHVGSKLNLDTSQEQYEFDVAGYGVNTTTAEDYAKAFLLIYKNKIPGSKELLAILRDQKINNMIPLFLPKGVICAHKTGDLNPLYHDGGICQDKKQSYILTIFTNAGDPNLLAHLSEIIYTKNYELVGSDLTKKPISENVQEEHPLDSMVMNPPRSTVLGASSTTKFPVPDITATDLGVTAKDLSLVIKDKDLPKVIIPADSPLHIFSDLFQIAKGAFVLRPKEKRIVDLETARLRLAEAKDLIKRGDTKNASVVLQNMQTELENLTKDHTIVRDSAAQNAIQAVSETRFAVLADELKQAKGVEKLSVIKDIASQAKATIHNIQPNIPDATNATNPSQKPFIGEISKINSTEVTVKTAGGQEITVPLNIDSPVVVKEKGAVPTSLPSVSETQKNPPTSSTPYTLSSLASLNVGTTVALIGSSTNNTFSPTLILTNIPKELAAPQPVTVAKVDTKHNTMVVIENGIYTQVNINKNTNIKGVDTNIPLKAIRSGDIIIVHGEPLTQTIPTITNTPVHITPSNSPTSSKKTQLERIVTSVPSTPDSKKIENNLQPQNSTEKQTRISKTPLPTQRGTLDQTSSVSPTQTQSTQPVPRVIQGTSVQLIEKKENIPQSPAQPTSQSKTEQKPLQFPAQDRSKSQQQSQPQEPPKNQSLPTAPQINKNDEKKK